MDHNIWQMLETLGKFIVAPIGVVIWWAFKKNNLRIEELEKRMNLVEKNNAVLEARFIELKEDLQEIKQSLSKLFDLINKKLD